MDMASDAHLNQGGEARGLEVEALEMLSPEDEREIRALRLSALDMSRDQNLEVLKRGMDTIINGFRKVDTNREMVVAREGSRIVGFLAFEKSSGIADVGEILLAEKHNQSKVLTDLIHGAEKCARDAGCARIVIHAPHASDGLPTICRLSEFSKSDAEGEEKGARFTKNLATFH